MASNKYGEVPENEDAISRKLRKLDLQYYFRSPYLWGLFIALGCAFIFLALPASKNRLETWSPGPLHSGHSMLENKCSACHAQSFKSVEDSSCNACHKVSEHGSEKNRVNIAHNAEHLALKRCGDCHIEHRDSKAFIPTETKLCIECHSNLSAVVNHPVNESFASFKAHSEFAVTQGEKRVCLSDKSNLKDSNPLQFNHAIHLKSGLKGPKGKVTMECAECHQFSHDSSDGNLISFEKNCRSCHELSFDDRLPQSHVPHGDAEVVFQSLLGEYSKLLGVELPKPSVMVDPRKIPGKAGEKPAERPVLLDSVIKEARTSEELLFTKTSCQLCHVIDRKENANSWSSNFEVEKPHIPEKWFPKASFSHSVHEIASCESCHTNVRKSKETSDVLLPGIDNCRSCHVDQGHKGLVPSDCSTCHQYHGSEPLKADRKKAIDELLEDFKR